MHILFVSHQMYPCVVGGAEIFNYYLARALADNHRVSIITTCPDPGDGLVKIRRVIPGVSFTKDALLTIQDILHIYLMKNDIDVIHLSYMAGSWRQWRPYPFFKNRYEIPYTMTIHGGGMHPWIPRKPYETLFRNAAGIIGVSPTIKEEYEKRAGRKVILIPPLLPFATHQDECASLRKDHGLNEGSFVFAHIGSLKKNKGVDLLFEAFLSLGKTFIEKHDLRLIFVGDGPMRWELEDNIARSGLDGRIMMYGAIKRERIPSFFALADTYVISSFVEGNPISLLEAMFNNLPVIGSDAPGIVDKINDGVNGLVFKRGNVTSLAACMKRMALERELRERLGKAARESYDASYDYSAVVRRYENVFHCASKNSSCE